MSFSGMRAVILVGVLVLLGVAVFKLGAAEACAGVVQFAVAPALGCSGSTLKESSASSVFRESENQSAASSGWQSLSHPIRACTRGIGRPWR